MYEIELELLNNINIEEIKATVATNKDKDKDRKIAKQVKTLSEIIYNEIKKNALKGNNLVSINIKDYDDKALYIIKDCLEKNNIYATIYYLIRNDNYLGFMDIGWD